MFGSVQSTEGWNVKVSEKLNSRPTPYKNSDASPVKFLFVTEPEVSVTEVLFSVSTFKKARSAKTFMPPKSNGVLIQQ